MRITIVAYIEGTEIAKQEFVSANASLTHQAAEIAFNLAKRQLSQMLDACEVEGDLWKGEEGPNEPPF